MRVVVRVGTGIEEIGEGEIDGAEEEEAGEGGDGEVAGAMGWEVDGKKQSVDG